MLYQILEKNVFVPAIVGFIFLISIFTINPYLFSSKTLKSKFTDQPQQHVLIVPDPGTSAKAEVDTSSLSLIRPDTQPQADSSYITARRYFLGNADIVHSPDEVDETNPIFAFASNFLLFLSKDKKQLSKVGLDSSILWTFKTQSHVFEDRFLVSKDRVYLSTAGNEVLALDLNQPKVRWLTALPYSIDLLELNKEQIIGIDIQADNYRLVSVSQKTGEVSIESELLSGKVNLYGVSDKGLFVSTTTGDVHFYDLDEFKLIKTVAVGSPLSAPPLFKDNQLIISTQSGLLTSWDWEKNIKGWETTLQAPAKGKMAVIPGHNRICMINQQGQMHCLNRSTGESEWRFNTATTMDFPVVFPARWPLSGQGEEVARLAKYGGWVAWVPCNDDRYCIFDPQNGQVLARHFLPGKVASAPMFGEDNFLIAGRMVKTGAKGSEKILKWSLIEFKAVLPKKPADAAAAQN